MHGRRLVILIAGNFFVATSFMSVSGLLNEISASLNLTVAQAGMLIAAFAVTAGVCAPVLATFGSRIDRRKLLTASLAICGLANLLGALSRTYEELLVTRILGAITSAVYTPQIAATVSMLVTEKERGPILAKLMMGWAIGAVIGGPITVLVGTHFGWRTSLGVIALGGSAIAVLVWRTLPAGVHVPALNLQRWIDIVRSPVLMFLTLTTLLHAIGNHMVFSYIAPTMLALHNAGGSLIAGLIFVNGLGGVVGSLAAVAAMQRLGVTRVAYVSVCLVIGVFVVWPFGASILAIIFISQFFWSMGSAGFPSIQQTRFVAAAPALASATIALNSSVGYLGNSLGATVGGHAWGWIGARYLPWAALIFMIGSLVFSVLSERATRRIDSDEPS
jgi:MFS transporter, DHA1 family, inner membrane transport protein